VSGGKNNTVQERECRKEQHSRRALKVGVPQGSSTLRKQQLLRRKVFWNYQGMMRVMLKIQFRMWCLS
jgi:hypothetical protein